MVFGLGILENFRKKKIKNESSVKFWKNIFGKFSKKKYSKTKFLGNFRKKYSKKRSFSKIFKPQFWEICEKYTLKRNFSKILKNCFCKSDFIILKNHLFEILVIFPVKIFLVNICHRIFRIIFIQYFDIIKN